MMKIFHVDAFTDRAFSGNCAAICILPGPGEESWMQKVAHEMNLSETAFLYGVEDWIELDIPAEPEVQVSPPPNLANALGVIPEYVGRNRFDYLVEVHSEETIRNMEPDFALLKKIPTRGVIVTSLANSGKYDFVSRFFAPGIGVDEDPVTGSAHCCLGPFWKERLGKNEFVAYQASSRGGIVRVRLSGNRVFLGGQAVTLVRGEIK
jgi:predicted PhzF superfamily epimerase YddE/YHI9